MRGALGALALLLAAGCSDTGTIVVEFDTPANAGEVLVVQVVGAGMDPSRPLAAERVVVPLGDAPQHACVTARGPAGEVNVRLRQCENETCTGAADGVPRTHTATIEDGVYAGKTTNVRLGAFRVDANTPVDRCDVRGCVDRFASSWCRLEDGAHFCEFQGDVPPMLDGCELRYELSF